jgi:ADP-ribosyl-[dinitrogen reductase] hydrolase
MHLSPQQIDRAVGVLVGQAAGDALGVPYEFGVRALSGEPQMLGGGLGGIAPGQWSEDTEMAVCIAEVAATGADLRSAEAQERIAEGFLRWYADGPPDIGVQTRTVLAETLRRGGPAAATMRAASSDLHAETGRTAGNGSLMRTGPVALAHLGDVDAMVEAAHLTSALTHADPVAGRRLRPVVLRDRACRADRRARRPRRPPPRRRRLLGTAARRGRDRRAVALRRQQRLGRRRPARRLVGDQPHLRARARSARRRRRRRRHRHHGGDRRPVARRRVRRQRRAREVPPAPARVARPARPRPAPAGVPRGSRRSGRAGGLAERSQPPVVPLCRDDRHEAPGRPRRAAGRGRCSATGGADAVVSLCRMGSDSAPLPGVAPQDHVESWLIDEDDANLDLAGQLVDAASAVRDLRAEGKTVLLHCVHAHSRTPTVAAVYGAMVTGSSPRAALDRVLEVLPSSYPRASFVEVLERLVFEP